MELAAGPGHDVRARYEQPRGERTGHRSTVMSAPSNLTLTYSRALADFFIFVIDVGKGDKIPRKHGPGITSSDLLVINKVFLRRWDR